MTDDQIHIEVLKVMGWKRGTREESSFADPSKQIVHDCWISPNGIPARRLPDLTLDLMRDAWLTLNAKQRAKYAEELAYVVLACHNDPKQEFVFSRCSLSLFSNATAAERARAFLAVKSTPSP